MSSTRAFPGGPPVRSLSATWLLPALLCAMVWVATASARVSAQQSSSLSACVGRVVHAARSQGAKASAQKPVDFLLTGDERSYEYTLPEAGCLGFLAVGQRHVLHLGLSLFTPAGGPLAQDSSRDAHAYARVCGGAGERVIVNVRMIDGEGEFHLVPLWNAPERLAALEPIMAGCMNAGTARPALVDVGPEPSGPPLEHSLLSVARQLGDLGYVRQDVAAMVGSLSERHRELRRVRLEAGHCYALAAVGDADVDDIDMRLLSLSGAGAVLATDIARSREAIVKSCPEHTAEYALDVRMYRGGGGYVLQSFELSDPSRPLPTGVEGSSRVAYLELAARLRSRGLRATPVAWGVISPEKEQSLRVPLQAGACYAVAVVASGDVTGGGDLDLTLVDGAGRVLAAELGPSPNPLLYHCAGPGLSSARAVVRSHQVRKPARFLLVMGEPAEEPRR